MLVDDEFMYKSLSSNIKLYFLFFNISEGIYSKNPLYLKINPIVCLTSFKYKSCENLFSISTELMISDDMTRFSTSIPQSVSSC